MHMRRMPAFLLAIAMLMGGGASALGYVDPGTMRSGSELQAGTLDRTSIAVRATYDVKLTLRYEAGTFSADSTMRITNESGVSIDRLELNTISANLGRMRVRTATVDGSRVTPRVEDMTLHVPLGGVLPNGASATVRLVFDATLRSGTAGSDWLFTRNTGIITMYRWLPWISRERPFARPSFGFPFMTRVSPKVTLQVTTDRSMKIATGGRRTSVTGLSQTFVAQNVRDMNIAASPWFQVLTGTVNGHTVQVFHRPGGPGQAMLDQAKAALTRVEARLGTYPWPVLTIANSSSRDYGAASPGSIWLPTGVDTSSLAYLMTHEVAHQWFFGVVGNDLAKYPFAHEGTSEFMARHLLGLQRASRCPTSRLDLTIYQYTSNCFYETVYVQGSLFLDTIRRRMGDSAFWRGVRLYMTERRFAFGSSKVFLDTLDRATPLDLRSLFDTRFPSYY
ncbi:MAG: hypothetical protein H0W07_03190 [Chloroflexi bacterium]|nr:hypothetical protein [Chloroflexota bacterium]